ncbi:hypothetical protein [Variovorax sp. SG517]|uniref:hypothetical protein n=1 Tax=unclassified Variovorax TaxID=663243 RepID=UPI00159D70E0|nr:hypothetical protein [Variovorax sp. SG517]NVM90985.1 uncharacterized protein YtpQ (UPF0354 family) [Variovorax sp. SG517]
MSSNPPSPSSVYPRIRTADFLQSVQPRLDEIEALGGDREAQTPVAYPFAGDSGLLVTYAFDTPTQFITLTNEGMASLGLTPEELHVRAVDNMLAKVLPQLGTQDLVLYKALVSGGDFEVCMLLVPGLWQELTNDFQGELLTVVPSRNVIYFMDSKASFEASGETIGPGQILGLMCAAAGKIRAEAGPHGLSEKVLALTPDGWHVRGSFADPASSLSND